MENNYIFKAFPFSWDNQQVTDSFCLSGLDHLYYSLDNNLVKQSYVVYTTKENLKEYDQKFFKRYE